jgi:hypothetical protein
MQDEPSLIHLARSVLCSAVLMAGASYTLPAATPHQCVTWTAMVVALTGVYYVCLNLWRSCSKRRHINGAEMTPIGPNPLHPLAEAAYTNVEDPQPLQHLTAASVYVYVYGWGVLLFVSLYSMSGLNEGGSCWWGAGMLMLSFDELVSRQAPRGWVTFVSTLLWTSVVALWWASNGALARDESLGSIMLGVVIPVFSPFIFFSLRSIRIVSRDVVALCEVALPFMLLISIGVLVNSDWSVLLYDHVEPPSYDQLAYSQSHTRLAKAQAHNLSYARAHTRQAKAQAHNLSYLETPSFFNPNGTELPTVSLPLAYLRLNKYLLFLGFPFIACAAIINLATCVLEGFVTEFIASFLLTLSVKLIATHRHPPWAAVLALGAAGVCFVVLVLLRRTL